MSAPRLHVPMPMAAGATLELPADAARHAQVLRLQPGDAVLLFAGHDDLEWRGRVAAMGRGTVSVVVDAVAEVRRELVPPVTVAVGMPANDRMDALVEKATELGAVRIVPLVCARSVLRLEGDRAEARRARWQSIAASASEQCGRTRVPVVERPGRFASALPALADDGLRWLMGFAPDAVPVGDAARALFDDGGASGLVVLSGPEGGLAAEEEAQARACGFVPVSLGPRVLRADTAPLAALAVLSGISLR